MEEGPRRRRGGERVVVGDGRLSVDRGLVPCSAAARREVDAQAGRGALAVRGRAWRGARVHALGLERQAEIPVIEAAPVEMLSRSSTRRVVDVADVLAGHPDLTAA